MNHLQDRAPQIRAWVPHFSRLLREVGILRDPFHNLARAIGRPVVDRDHFVVVVIERK